MSLSKLQDTQWEAWSKSGGKKGKESSTGSPSDESGKPQQWHHAAAKSLSGVSASAGSCLDSVGLKAGSIGSHMEALPLIS